MKIEQRRYERIVITGDVSLNHNNSIINCRIENISNYGAYMKVDSAHSDRRIEIGDSVTFSLSSPKLTVKELSGQILRRTVEGDNLFLAVYFMSPCSLD